MSSPEIEREIERLRQDYARIEGRPFEHFYCPVLFRDDPAKLCKGHVVNDGIPGSTKLWAVQREDVDNWYGKAFEGDMVAMIRAHDMSVLETLEDRSVSGRTDQLITAGGESVRIYRDTGTPIPTHHSPVVISEGEKAIPYVICKSPAQLDDTDLMKWQIRLTFDSRLAGLVSILKAAHLSMFRLMGYAYALSASGIHIGKDLLGNFYLNNRGKRNRDIHEAGLEHFRQCVNMVRPTEYAGDAPKGTVEDGRIGVCFRSCGSRRPFGYIVIVRTGRHLHAVFVPTLGSEADAVAFHQFMTDDSTTLHVSSGLFDTKAGVLKVEERSQEMTWVKDDPGTALMD